MYCGCPETNHWVRILSCKGARQWTHDDAHDNALLPLTQKWYYRLGYNGFPAGCSDDVLPWARQGTSALHTKYLYVCHSEVNAILNAANNVQGATLYVALFPCNECAKMIIQAGIREVVYLSDRYHASNACRASRIMFQMAGVTLRKHIPRQTKVRISFETNKKPQPPTTDNE